LSTRRPSIASIDAKEKFQDFFVPLFFLWEYKKGFFLLLLYGYTALFIGVFF